MGFVGKRDRNMSRVSGRVNRRSGGATGGGTGADTRELGLRYQFFLD